MRTLRTHLGRKLWFRDLPCSQVVETSQAKCGALNCIYPEPLQHAGLKGSVGTPLMGWEMQLKMWEAKAGLPQLLGIQPVLETTQRRRERRARGLQAGNEARTGILRLLDIQSLLEVTEELRTEEPSGLRTNLGLGEGDSGLALLRLSWLSRSTEGPSVGDLGGAALQTKAFSTLPLMVLNERDSVWLQSVYCSRWKTGACPRLRLDLEIKYCLQ